MADRQDDVIARVNKVIYIRKMPNLEHKVFNKPWRAKNELWERRLAAICPLVCLEIAARRRSHSLSLAPLLLKLMTLSVKF